MAISDISLTSGMRNNLMQLQNTSTLVARTQERLATGRKVNTALDNPTNYFAAQSANNRAGDLGIRKDGMAEAIQTVKASDAGVSAITSLVEAAKGLAAAALGTSSTIDRAAFAGQFATLLTQINSLGSDSGYRGTNLLGGATMTVTFNENASSTLKVNGFTASNIGLSIAAPVASWSNAGDGDITMSQANLATATNELRNQSKNLANNLNIITSRQTFTDNMISTLQTGANNLTLADMNEEGANMLMLQTRQSLGTTALSLSSQAAQSVLRLF
ncbi:MAG TPA: flagellin [Desulfuromonadales bacterium]|nr:flagellin [Desulfuromonadales bacterium]